MEDRYYTLTLKPVQKEYKGNMLYLRASYLQLIDIVGGQTEEFTFEKVDTPMLHLHALIRCPYIKSKYHIAKLLPGYHIHMKVIVKNANQEQILNKWKLYITKERSDSDRYTDVFGNMFPLEELY